MFGTTQMNRLALLLFSLLIISSCAVLNGEKSAQPAAEIHFTILQMNDVYEIAPLEKGKVGGMARVATVRKELIKENPNLLTVHAGDFLNPSLLGTLKFQGERIKGRQMVEVMNGLEIDVVAFGNHEFDIKENELQQRMNESDFTWIGTNVLHQKGEGLSAFHKEKNGKKSYSPEYYIWGFKDEKTGKGLKIGFYSACINSTKKDYVYYEDPYQEAAKAFNEMKGNVDVILGLTHLSIEQDLKMAAQLPETVLIMGGHEHDNSINKVGNVVITKADANVKTVYVHRFSHNLQTKKTTVESTLVPIDDKIEADPELNKVVEKWQQIQDNEILEVVANPNEVVYTAKIPLDGREGSVRNRQTNLGEMITAGMSASLKKKADCVILNSGSIRLDDQLSGDIIATDLFRTMPFGGGIYEIDLKGDILKRALNAGLENAGAGGYLQWHNITYNEADQSWQINNEPLDETKTYHIASSEYLANGYENRLEFFKEENFVNTEKPNNNDPDDLRTDVRKAVIAYMKTL